MKVRPFLYGFISGGIAAGISILLTTPHSGKVNRVRLRENKQLILTQLLEVKTNLMKIKDSAAYATKEGRMQIATFLSGIKSSIAQWEKEIKPQQLRIQREIIEMKETVEEIEKKISEYSK